MAVDLTPTASELAELQAQVRALAAQVARLQGERDHWQAEAARWQHSYRAQQGHAAVREAEVTRLRGRIAGCRCWELPAGREG